MNELADAVVQRERHAKRCQAKLEDQARQHKKEQERLQARVAALEYELEACKRPPSKKKESKMQMMHSHIQNDCGKCNANISGQQVYPVPSTASYWQQQCKQGQGRKNGHGKTMDSNGGKWSRKDNKERKQYRRPTPSRKWKDYECE